MNDGILSDLAIEAHGVDEQVVRRRSQAHHSIAHRESRRLIDIDLVDQGRVHGGDRPGQRVRANARSQGLAPFR